MAGENPFRRYVPQQGPTVTPLPESPGRTADRQRADAAAQRDAEAAARDAARTGIAVRAEPRDIGYREYDNTLKLRSDFDAMPEVQNYRTAIPLFVQGLKTANTPQGSNALIYAYAKIMDPGSVVRESEAEGIASSDTIFGRAYAYAQKQLEGNGTFSPEAREGLIREMRTKTIELARSYDNQRNRFEADAQAFGIDPVRVVGPHDALPFVEELQRFDRQEGRLTREQQQQYDAILTADPNATPEQLRAKLEAAGLPVATNLEEIVAARNEGRGVAPAAKASYQESIVGQGMSGVNEGIASTLGLPVDAVTWAMNLVPQGINAVANTDIPSIEKPFMGGDWFREALGPTIYEPTDDPAAQFARRTGQSVGAAAVPIGGTASTVRQGVAGLLAAGAGGAGAATAQQVAPGNVGAEIAAELLASGGVGLGSLAAGRRAAQRELESAIPTVPQLKEQAGAVYQRAEQRGATADPQLTQQLADDVRTTLRDEGQLGPSGRITDADTSTTKAFNLIEQYAGQPMNPREMDTVRGVIAEGRRSPDASDQRISKLLLDQFDDWARPLVPDFDEARDISSRYLQAEDLEMARELAGVQAGQFSGSGFENALRTQYRGLDRNSVRGRNWFTPEVTEAVQDVSRGTPASNVARGLGKMAPTGVVSGGLGFGVPFVVGNAVGGPALGTALGVGATGLGYAGRTAATQMGLRNAEIAELLARNGGPLPEAALMSPETERLIAAILAGQQGEYLQESPGP